MINKTSSLKPLQSVCLAVLLAASTAAHAGIKVYTSQGEFLAAVSNPGTDTYDDLAAASLGASLGRRAGDYRYTLWSPDGLARAGGPDDYWLSNATPGDLLLFSGFSPGVKAFGGSFFGADAAGQYAPSGQLILGAADGSTITYALAGGSRDGFIGFVSDANLNSVVLVNASNGSYWPAANNLILAAVPEPVTYGMFLAGLGLIGAMARRR